MKKSSKPFIAIVVFFLITIAVIVLGYVSIKLKCEVMTKQKVLAEEKLNAKNNTRVSLFAEYQYYTAEDRIVQIAKDDLGLIKQNSPSIKIDVSKERIQEISKMINGKYE